MNAKDWAEERVMRFTAQHWPVRKDRSLTPEAQFSLIRATWDGLLFPYQLREKIDLYLSQ